MANVVQTAFDELEGFATLCDDIEAEMEEQHRLDTGNAWKAIAELGMLWRGCYILLIEGKVSFEKLIEEKFPH